MSTSGIDYTAEQTYEKTRLPVDLATTLIPDAYRTEAFYGLEQDKVFANSWVAVGYTSEVNETGKMLTATVGGQSLFVTRDDQGTLRAFYNVCRHRGSRLVTDNAPCKIIRCPYHSWGYALDGRLIGAPYFKGIELTDAEKAAYDTSHVKEFRTADYGLLPVNVDSWGCFIFINLSENPVPLKTYLGDLPDQLQRFPLSELQLVRRKNYQIKANWKLVAENFIEYYHLPAVHPELCNVSRVEDHHRRQGPGMYVGFCTSPLTQAPDTVSFDLPTMKNLNAEESNSAYFYLIFPNIALFLLPNHLFTLLYNPVAPDQTVEFGDFLIHPDAMNAPHANEAIDGILDFWDLVNRQDITAVERVQEGLSNKAYPGGRMCFRFEETVHRFQNMVIDRMTGTDRIPPGDG